MKAARIFQYGSVDVIQNTDIARPEPGKDLIRVQVKAAGVGPWDALVREGKSAIPHTLPLTLGSDIAGVVDAIGTDVSGFKIGDEVYGVTNAQFTGGYAEYALASPGMMARKPNVLSFIEAASVPVVAVTASQMLFDYAHVAAGQKVFVLGGAGNVGAYAVQMAKNAGLDVSATASSRDHEYVKALGASTVVDYHGVRFEDVVTAVDVVADTVGGEMRERSLSILKPSGILVSVVSSPIPKGATDDNSPKSVFFIVDVTTRRLNTITELFESGKLAAHVGTVLKLEEARLAHQMFAGAPHARGKIVLNIAA